MVKNILISGAGIAGPTLAYWLFRYGMRATLIERAAKIRTEGQTIDIRGVGTEIIRMMGIDQIIRNTTTEEKGIKFVDVDNNIKAVFPVDADNGPDFVAEIEILRGDLARILYEHTRTNVEYIFEDKITTVKDHGDRVQVSFSKTADRDFDLVLLADGLGSRTRKLVFQDSGASIRRLNQYVAYFSIPYQESDGAWARWCNAPGGRSVTIRPDGRERQTSRVYMAICNSDRKLEGIGVENQKAALHQLFEDFGWEVPRVLSDMDKCKDFYLQEIAQMKMTNWSQGRVAVVGDAAYCPSPISGMGTTAAIVGAYVLAGEIARHQDYNEAFVSYESLLRPFITRAQKLVPGAPQVANPQTEWGITMLQTALRVMSFGLRLGAGKLIKKFMAPPGDSITLPNYDKHLKN